MPLVPKSGYSGKGHRIKGILVFCFHHVSHKLAVIVLISKCFEFLWLCCQAATIKCPMGKECVFDMIVFDIAV